MATLKISGTSLLLLLMIGIFLYFLAGGSLIHIDQSSNVFRFFSISEPTIPHLEKSIDDPSIDYARVDGLRIHGLRVCSDPQRCPNNAARVSIGGVLFDTFPGGACAVNADGRLMMSVDGFGKDYAITGALIRDQKITFDNYCGNIQRADVTITERVECVTDLDCSRSNFAGLSRSAGGQCVQSSHTCFYGVQPITPHQKHTRTITLLSITFFIVLIGWLLLRRW